MKAGETREAEQLPYPYGDASNDEKILTAVLNALHWHPGVPNEQVQVEVRRGHVVLSGMVSRDYERELAERNAAEAPGVVEVTNLIKVVN